MQSPVEVVTREEVIELAKIMPIEKLAVWYEYGLFVQSRPLTIPDTLTAQDDDELIKEFAAWEAASDEDWLKMERTIGDLT